MKRKLTIICLLAQACAFGDLYLDGLDTLSEARTEIPMIREVRIREIADNQIEAAIWMLRQDRFSHAHLICARMFVDIGGAITDYNDPSAIRLLEKIKLAEHQFKQFNYGVL